tara:strand:- start:2833 stop:3726 length:894 start_codon:yes stop_codon:yes gene_type:complete
MDNNLLTKKTLISSKGYLDNSYSKKKTESVSNENEIINMMNESYPVIFIRTGSKKNKIDLNIFSKNLHHLKKPCILVTSDGDRPVPSSYDINICNKILNNLNIKKWYTQNYDNSIKHKKLDYYPIGFDFHTEKWLVNKSVESKINVMFYNRIRSPVDERIKNKVFSDTHNSISHPDRKLVYDIIKNNKMFEKSKNRESFIDITEKYNKYNFVISPRGNGLDCHRTWELFFAGVIVITKTSSLDNMFINNNLPVVILQDWNELNNITPDILNFWYIKHKQNTKLDNIIPRLLYDYWIK